jgi:hypothetical protein
VEILHLLPLFRRELAPQPQQEAGIGLFQFGPGLRHFIDLRQDLGLIRLLGT